MISTIKSYTILKQKQQINFLPCLPKIKKNRLTFSFFVCFNILLIVLLFIIYFFVRYETIEKIDFIQSLNVKMMEQRKILSDLEEKQKKYERKYFDYIKYNTAWKKQLLLWHKPDGIYFYTWFKAISRKSIPDVWISKIKISNSGSRIKIYGNAYHAKDVLDYLNRLDNDAALKNTKFIVGSINKVKGKKYNRFLIKNVFKEEAGNVIFKAKE